MKAQRDEATLAAARDAIVRRHAGIPQRPDFDVWDALEIALEATEHVALVEPESS